MSPRGVPGAARRTASVGSMIGTGMYFPAALAVALALGTLAVFRCVELPYTVTIHSRGERNRATLAVALQELPSARSFGLAPIGS